MVALVVVFGVLVWIGATLLIDAVRRRHHRPSLTERLWPYRTPSVADEAETWLRQDR